MVYKALLSFLFFFSSCPKFISATENKNEIKLKKELKSSIDSTIDLMYTSLNANKHSVPKHEIFVQALQGYYLLKEKGLVKKNILTLVDFSLSSNCKRLWVIDLATNTVLFQSLVAHGRNTGEEFAKSFSNSAQSFKSSLGFYTTGEIYTGKHGMSLKLDGLEKGVNDNARNRGVVIHGADYVSDVFIKNNKRLGRSQGCPALPEELSKAIIDVIKDKSCFFIYHPSVISKIIS